LAPDCGTVEPLSDQTERLNPGACISALKGLQGRIRDRGVQPRDLEMIRAPYGDQPTENAAVAMYQLLAVAVKKKVEQDEAAETKEDPNSKKEILGTMETEIQQQEIREDLAQRMMAIESASDVQEPRSPSLESLLRYPAANIREFNILLDSLEGIRRLR
jgi:hypothetical protein